MPLNRKLVVAEDREVEVVVRAARRTQEQLERPAARDHPRNADARQLLGGALDRREARRPNVPAVGFPLEPSHQFGLAVGVGGAVVPEALGQLEFERFVAPRRPCLGAQVVAKEQMPRPVFGLEAEHVEVNLVRPTGEVVAPRKPVLAPVVVAERS